MGPFPPSKKSEFILVAVDYVSKRVEALPCKHTDNISSKRMFEEVIFPRFGVPRVVISDGGAHFIDKRFKQYLSKLGVDIWERNKELIRKHTDIGEHFTWDVI